MRKVVKTPIAPPRDEAEVLDLRIAIDAGSVKAKPIPWTARSRTSGR